MLSLLSASFAGLAAAAGTYVTNADPIEGSYFVRLHSKYKFKDVEEHLEKWGSRVNVTYKYPTLSEYGLPAYAAKFDEDVRRELLALEEVDVIEQDGWSYALQQQCGTVRDATWGLGRVGASGSQTCSGTTTGTGNCPWDHISNKNDEVNVYILDTGIYCGNNEFTGGPSECEWAFSADSGPLWCSPGDNSCDGNGHGTHCAGTVGGNDYGIDKYVNLKNVQVLSRAGSGTNAGVVAGIDYAAGADPGMPGVLSMSLGGSGNSQSTTSRAVDACVESGRAVAVAAGNDGQNACNNSPASARLAFTVGATTSSNSFASYSSTGNCVDILAPGSSITSAWIDGPNSVNTISGTSMACPHVAGVLASLLSRDPSLSPEELVEGALGLAIPNVISSVPIGTPNLLLHFACDAQ